MKKQNKGNIKMMYKKRYRTPDLCDDIILISDGEYLTGLYFENSYNALTALKNSIDEHLPVFEMTEKWLDIYFSGKSPDFIPPYRLCGATPFRQCVSDIIRQIPYGKTVSYGDIASEIAQKRNIKKMSAQAVGGAVGWNPICIIIPCHRVIGANGRLVGYGGGIKNKEYLLRHERITAAGL